MEVLSGQLLAGEIEVWGVGVGGMLDANQGACEP